MPCSSDSRFIARAKSVCQGAGLAKRGSSDFCWISPISREKETFAKLLLNLRKGLSLAIAAQVRNRVGAPRGSAEHPCGAGCGSPPALPWAGAAGHVGVVWQRESWPGVGRVLLCRSQRLRGGTASTSRGRFKSYLIQINFLRSTTRCAFLR